MVDNANSRHKCGPTAADRPSDVAKLLDDHAVEKITGRARSTLQKDRVRGDGIPFVRIGRLVRYRPQDVAAWLNGLPTLHSTSQTGRAV